ncbi:MAG: hypothetical protein COB20_12385 [SAR86 cluster bacterium]|uniref:Uncharacterized protein n=1 Tax=SAR86 cluster bacterium TaxID=2030880 RepID=A0A2A4WZB8_9GAMM|nr:MAG: hypothetical protein COB20_12385 [SAR86 cluster bacterium]
MEQQMDNDTSLETSSQGIETMQRLWPQLRKFGVFQLKLYIDAFRDILLSALSLGAFIIDLIQQNDGPDSYFEKVLRFGRRTEKSINLFNQFDAQERGDRSVDSIINEVEDRFRR